MSDLKETVSRYALCKKRSNKVNNVIHYSENYPGLSLGVECVSGRLALKKLPCADTNKKANVQYSRRFSF